MSHPQAILLIGFMSNGRDRAKLAKYKAELEAAGGTAVFCCYYDELLIELAPTTFTVFDLHNRRPLESYDMVLFRGAMQKTYLANVVCHFLADRGISFLNDFRSYKSSNKLLQAVDFYHLGLTFPRTWYCAGRQRLLGHVVEQAGYPLIIKAVSGSQGRDNFCIRRPADFIQVSRRPGRISFLAQAFVPNDHDYRLLFIDGQLLVAQRTGIAGSHLNNLSQGATIQKVPVNVLPPGLRRQAARLVAHCQLRLAGVDIVRDTNTGRYYFLEINAQPGWRTLEAEVQPLLHRLLQR